MAAHNSRLTRIEQQLAACARRKNARLEPQPAAQGARPGWMDEVELVRGHRRPAVASRSLLSLEGQLLGRRKGTGQRRSQSFDHGAPIELSYSESYYANPAGSVGELAAQSSLLPGLEPETAGFTVESFEVEGETPVDLRRELERDPLAGRGRPASEVPARAAPASNTPALERLADSQALESRGDPESQAFERDLEAILGGGKHRTRPEPEPGAELSARAGPDLVEPRQPANEVGHAHSVFDRMGTGLAYATTFDLGPVELEHRFREFDRALAADEIKPATAAARSGSLPGGAGTAMELEERELAADLASIVAEPRLELPAAPPAPAWPPAPSVHVEPFVPAPAAPAGPAAPQDPPPPEVLAATLEAARGAPAEHPMHPRCRSLELAVPANFADFEAAIRGWIGTCVMSRTEVRGVPIRRERELVDANASLREVWEAVRGLSGQKAQVLADFNWGMERVESIRFFLPARSIEMPPEEIRAPLYHTVVEGLERASRAIDKLEQRGEQSLSGVSLKHLRCLAETARAAGGDDRVVWAERFTPKMDAYMRGEVPLEELLLRFNERWTTVRRDEGDADVLKRLLFLSDSIGQVIDFLRRHKLQTEVHAVNPHLMRLSSWIVERSKDPHSLYHCFNLP